MLVKSLQFYTSISMEKNNSELLLVPLDYNEELGDFESYASWNMRRQDQCLAEPHKIDINLNDLETLKSLLTGGIFHINFEKSVLARANSFMLTFELQLNHNIHLDVSNLRSLSCWQQALFPKHFSNPVYVS